ncbi:PspC domain-containing protein [Dermacoccaceae bacterium W4C1]
MPSTLGAAATSDAPMRPPLLRPNSGRMLAGVCRGLATHLGAPVGFVRLATVLVSVTGPGVVVYGFLWLTMARGEVPQDRVEPLVSRLPLSRRVLAVLGVVLLLAAGSAALALRALDPARLLPVLAIAGGLLLTWSMLDRGRRRSWLGDHDIGSRESLIRTGVGATLVFGGFVVLASTGRGVSGVRDVLLATLVVLFGVVMLAAPFVIRVWENMRIEQTARIRATEKADIAAHLHDSVLQTLALIQRSAEDPVSVQRLARSQERELRQWLFADTPTGETSIGAAVREAVTEIEDRSGVPVELVTTGDQPLQEHGQALVQAVREAVWNAVRHGRAPVTVYLEVGPSAVEVFVRDHGAGFDPEEIAEDRHGVRSSIIGRMERHGGSATVRRRDPGTEVALSLPHEHSENSEHSPEAAPAEEEVSR